VFYKTANSFTAAALNEGLTRIELLKVKTPAASASTKTLTRGDISGGFTPPDSLADVPTPPLKYK
jgi:hypothetical protein